MFRLWGKLFKDNRMVKDMTVCDDSSDTRTHKIFRGLEDICYAWDLGKPIWLDSRIFSATKKRGSIRIILSKPLTSTFWRFRSLKNSPKSRTSREYDDIRHISRDILHLPVTEEQSSTARSRRHFCARHRQKRPAADAYSLFISSSLSFS